jgi:hypothetical protein
MFGSIVKIIEFEWNDFVKLILVKSEFNKVIYVWIYLCESDLFNNKLMCKNHILDSKATNPSFKLKPNMLKSFYASKFNSGGSKCGTKHRLSLCVCLI